MKTKELTLSAVMTAIVIIIEVLAARTGEALVILTMASTLPIYMLTRKRIILGIISYGVVGFILMLTNIHQLVFFYVQMG